ncbi:MAG: hypothetical protein LBT27_01550, partial [Prevotellaceae bacterium]|nr:hypothetical protein [Prevotellaceae bacterium]
DISQHSISELLPALKREYEKARDIKDKENLLAIIGNPPYFGGKSQAKTDVIDGELKKYKKGLNEKNIQPLNDLYIKFIRFAEWKIERCGYGVIGIITNNSFLDGITHRKMREHLYNTFDEIYIVNLHGNMRKGKGDKNIFDIKLGVSITFLVKRQNITTKPLKNSKNRLGLPKTVKYFSILNNNLISRAEKLSFLEDADFSKIQWKELHPAETPYFWFTDKDLSLEDAYKKFWKITDIFENYESGITTGRDNEVVNYKYFNSKNNQPITYRTFDERFIDYNLKNIDRHRIKIMKHFLIKNEENRGLCFMRGINNGINFGHIFIVNKMMDTNLCGARLYVAPLYFYNGHKENGIYEIEFDDNSVKTDNFTQKFIQNYLQKLSFKPAPEEILAYIYAVLHSPVYRTKYIEFLKTDFPAVPMTKNADIFKQYAKLGQKLINLHLLKNLPDDAKIRFSLAGIENNFTIEKIGQSGEKLFLNVVEDKTITITISGVTEKIYNFEIGSYRPIDKWLKYRIKDHVSLDVSDLNHLKNMIVAIKGTIATMQKIENLEETYLQ